MGLITKGMGVVLKHIKKAKPKKPLKTIYRVKPGVDINQYKRSKKHSWSKKLVLRLRGSQEKRYNKQAQA